MLKTRVRSMFGALLFAPSLLFAACSEPTGPVLVRHLAGTYALVSINGISIPGVIFDGSGGGTKVEVLSGSISLREDGTCSASSHSRTTSPDEPVWERKRVDVPCTYTFSEDTVALRFEGDAEDDVYTVNGNTLTRLQKRNAGDIEYVFRKQ